MLYYNIVCFTAYYREPLKPQFERKRAIHFMPLCMRASCALLAAIPRLPAVTVYCVKPPNRAPARLRRLSLYPTQLSHFLFSKRFLEVPYNILSGNTMSQTVKSKRYDIILSQKGKILCFAEIAETRSKITLSSVRYAEAPNSPQLPPRVRKPQ